MRFEFLFLDEANPDFSANNFPIQMTTRPTLKAFISYARDDEKYFEVLVKGLKQHSRLSKIFNCELWDDREILAGDKMARTNPAASSGVRLCPAFHQCRILHSSYIEKHEYGEFLQKAKGRKRFLVLIRKLRAIVMTAVLNYVITEDLAGRRVAAGSPWAVCLLHHRWGLKPLLFLLFEAQLRLSFQRVLRSSLSRRPSSSRSTPIRVPEPGGTQV